MFPWEEFDQRMEARRQARAIMQEKREKRTAWIVLVVATLLAGYIVIASVWGVMT